MTPRTTVLGGRAARLIRSDAARLIAVGLVAQGVTLISGPLLARMLGDHGRGQLALVMAAALVCNQLIFNSLGAGITRAVARRHRPARDVVGKNLARWLRWAAGAAVAATLIIALYVRNSDGAAGLCAMTFVVGFSGAVLGLYRAMVRGENGLSTINRADLAIPFSYVGIVVLLFLVWRDAPVWVVLAAFAAGQGLSLVIMRRGLQPHGDRTEDESFGPEVHRFAREGYFASIGMMDRLGLDSLILGALLGTATVGLYATASVVAAIPALLIGRLAVMVLPRMAAAPPEVAAALLRRWVIGSLVLILPVVVLLWAFMTPLVRVLFGEVFVPGAHAGQWLVIANSAFALRLILIAAVAAQGRERRGSVVSLVSSLALLAALAVGAQIGGLDGAALGVAIAAVLGCLATAGTVSWNGKGVVTATS